ncbi:MAG: rod shape-determining protein RodA [Bacteroidales bacterium]|nr:rod shape-determining protein RodA [Bacteroidales bacterium]
MESQSTKQSLIRNLDWTTIILYATMIIAGVISIYAASYDYDNASMFSFDEFSGKQIRWIGLSFILGLVILLIDSRLYETYAYPIYIGMILLLIITIFIAPNIKGSHSWIVLGPMSLQPAEFAKFATALALAKLFNAYNFTIKGNNQNFFKAITIIFIPIVLILAQNETGSALVYLSLFFVLYREGMSGLILFAALLAIVIFVVAIKFSETIILGIPSGEFYIYILLIAIMNLMLAFYCKKYNIARQITICITISAIIIYILTLFNLKINGTIYFISAIAISILYCLFELFKYKSNKILITIATIILSISFLFSVNYVFDNVLEPHQQQRIKVALGIEEDLRGAGYNVNQSKIAIGSGGFAGKGFLNGTQTKLKYVPEQHTDFIFCTIGEEEGFIGTSIVTMLFLALILRIIKIAERQPTTFGRVYSYCVACYLIFHFCINIGMVIGLCPVIGIPLPFFSYGGSSLWGFTILLFILLRIDASRRYHLSH